MVGKLPLAASTPPTHTHTTANMHAHRYAWALVHSARKADIDGGLKLARTMLREGEGHARDVGYLEAVALYRMGKYLDARRACDTILEVGVHVCGCVGAGGLGKGSARALKRQNGTACK